MRDLLPIICSGQARRADGSISSAARKSPGSHDPAPRGSARISIRFGLQSPCKGFTAARPEVVQPDDRMAAHNRDHVGGLDRLFDVAGRDYYRAVVAGGAYRVDDVPPRTDVDALKGLVEQKQAARRRRPAANHHLLLIASGQQIKRPSDHGSERRVWRTAPSSATKRAGFLPTPPSPTQFVIRDAISRRPAFISANPPCSGRRFFSGPARRRAESDLLVSTPSASSFRSRRKPR